MLKFRQIKPEIRIIAFDDGPFKYSIKGKCILIGVIYRGGNFIDGLLKTEINIDGTDAENEIICLLKRTKHKDIRIIMLDGITFGGFNIVNIKNIFKKTKMPVIVINRKKPDLKNFCKVIKKLRKNSKIRLKAVEDAGPLNFVNINNKKIWYQFCGINKKTCEDIIKISTNHSNIPEPLRVAHIIATGIVLGESRGRA